MVSPGAKAYPHNQPAIAWTIPCYKNHIAVSIDKRNVVVCSPRFGDGGQDR